MRVSPAPITPPALSPDAPQSPPSCLGETPAMRETAMRLKEDFLREQFRPVDAEGAAGMREQVEDVRRRKCAGNAFGVRGYGQTARRAALAAGVPGPHADPERNYARAKRYWLFASLPAQGTELLRLPLQGSLVLGPGVDAARRAAWSCGRWGLVKSYAIRGEPWVEAMGALLAQGEPHLPDKVRNAPGLKEDAGRAKVLLRLRREVERIYFADGSPAPAALEAAFARLLRQQHERHREAVAGAQYIWSSQFGATPVDACSWPATASCWPRARSARRASPRRWCIWPRRRSSGCCATRWRCVSRRSTATWRRRGRRRRAGAS
ncbi:MAG: hypothetical protein MO847_00700 [Candidatus Protistobacter heckmanni]|nr:hypothetical protein [Candidatus Protistobacter heckmanni]